MSQLKFRITMDFRIAFEDTSTKPVTNDEYRERAMALFAEMEGKITALGLPASPTRTGDEPKLDAKCCTSVMDDYPGIMNIFDHWVVRKPPPKGLSFPPELQ